jgi:tetratricopeptide (TPR) repeat protein
MRLERLLWIGLGLGSGLLFGAAGAGACEAAGARAGPPEARLQAEAAPPSAAAQAKAVQAPAAQAPAAQAPAAQAPAAPSAAGAQQPRTSKAEAQARLVELLALGLLTDALAFGEPLVAAGQPLAGDGTLRALVARALFSAGREEQALALLDGAALPAAEQVPLALERARLWIDQDRLEEARALLQRPGGSGLPALYPEEPDCWFLLAKVHARQGRLDAAALLAKRFLQMAPLDGQAATAWHLIAQEALARGDGEAAAKALERHRFLEEWHGLFRARRLQAFRAPEAALPRLGLGLLWMRVERYGEAQAEFEAALARDPKLEGACFQLGEARRLSGDPSGALEAYERGLALAPEDLELRSNRGLLLLSLGRPEGAQDLEFVVAKPASNTAAFAPVFLGLARHLRADDPARAAELHARYAALGGKEPLEPPAAKPPGEPAPAGG